MDVQRQRIYVLHPPKAVKPVNYQVNTAWRTEISELRDSMQYDALIGAIKLVRQCWFSFSLCSILLSELVNFDEVKYTHPLLAERIKSCTLASTHSPVWTPKIPGKNLVLVADVAFANSA